MSILLSEEGQQRIVATYKKHHHNPVHIHTTQPWTQCEGQYDSIAEYSAWGFCIVKSYYDSMYRVLSTGNIHSEGLLNLIK